MVNSVYSPYTESTDKSPPWRRATSAAMGSPSPAPAAPSRVEKKGLKICPMTSSEMPVPLSRTRTSTLRSTARLEMTSLGV